MKKMAECEYAEEAWYAGDYKVWLKFNTGEQGVVDLGDVVFGSEAARPLRDKKEFVGLSGSERLKHGNAESRMGSASLGEDAWSTVNRTEMDAPLVRPQEPGTGRAAAKRLPAIFELGTSVLLGLWQRT